MAAKYSRRRVFHWQPDGVKPDLLQHYQQAGQELDVQPALIRAIAIVESNEKPFAPGGGLVVRFEQAHWRRYRQASRAALAFDHVHNANDLDERWIQFEAMRQVQEVPAILSHSFGMFQIMGFNHMACSCASPVVFLKTMETIEGQFLLFKQLMLGTPEMLGALRRQDAPTLAKHFNGPRYEANRWDVKFAAAAKAGGSVAWA